MKFTTDFTTISHHTECEIAKAIKLDLNADMIFLCKYSNHPDDDYLYLYIAQLKADAYIAGLANTSRNGYVGLYENHYNCTFKHAMEITMDKIKDCNKGEI
jgi:hypothetical protein